ncbi:MAG: sigma-70 family RNA polymerase sigma factor, partial [Bacteroidota bacterium]
NYINQYILVMVRNACKSIFQKKKRDSLRKDDFLRYQKNRSSLRPDGESDICNKIDRSYYKQQLYLEFRSLTLKQKTAFNLRYLEGLSYEECSKRMNISKETFKEHLAISRKTLRRVAKRLFPE